MTFSIVRPRWLLVLAGVCAACQSSNYITPTVPAPINVHAPFAINLSVVVGTATSADHATITAAVQDATGTALSGVSVTFATTQGTLTPATVVTDNNGVATSTLVARTTAQVTATAGNVSVQREVDTQPPVSTSPTPTPTPPIPAPAPPSFPGNIVLNLPTAGTVNVGVNMFVSGPQNAGPIAWSFGDGASDQTDSYATSHTYSAVGTYTVTATGVGISKTTSAKITISTP